MTNARFIRLTKYWHQLPWLSAYLRDRITKSLRKDSGDIKRYIFVIANHFEPAWSKDGNLPLDKQLKRLEKWNKAASQIGTRLTDSDGMPFRHTNFYPAEQYHKEILNMLADLQSEGFCEVEVHLHHGVERPDTSNNLKFVLEEFRDCLAEEHKCLSRKSDDPMPKYAFVHGNLALGNSANGRFCGVDNELEILRDTGCYADFTLPSAPDISQVPVVNQIYQSGLPLSTCAPHKKAQPLTNNCSLTSSPVIFTGPLMIGWRLKQHRFPFPYIEDGALSASQGLSKLRFSLWANADISITQRPDWIFIKLYCHGFFDQDMPYCIGGTAEHFFSKLIDESNRTGKFTVHFAVAREAYNILAAALDGHSGNPHHYRDYLLTPIMNYKHNGDISPKSTTN
jgi:hypothetical protein